MKKPPVALALWLLVGVAATQGAYQVPGFPPFAPAPKMLEVVADRGETVLVRHAYGEIEIPQNPQRVLTDGSALEPILALGVTPVGSDITFSSAETPPRLARQLEETTSLGRSVTDLEAVLALNRT